MHVKLKEMLYVIACIYTIIYSRQKLMYSLYLSEVTIPIDTKVYSIYVLVIKYNTNWDGKKKCI
jgi:hypothetical protein